MVWIDGDDKILTEAESMNNAQLVANHFKGTSWVSASISALCGNMRHESWINPNIYEFGYGHSLDRGYGLVQWTPATKYIDWANSNGLPYTSGDSQLARIDYEVDQNIQWIANGYKLRYQNSESRYDITFAQFRTNEFNYTVEQLAEAFMWNYEGPAFSAGNDSLVARQTFARKCLIELDWTGTGGGIPPSDDKKKKHQALIQMFLANTLRGWG